MQNLLEELKSTLEIDDRLVIDGKLNKNKIVEMALALDGELLALLLKNDTIKKHFFKEVSGTLIFDKIEFQRFVSNKQFLPDSYTAFKNKIGLTANGEYLTESKEVVLAWPYKDCVLEGGQTKEDQKRKEIFWNATLAPDEIDRLLDPKVLTNFKKYDKDGEHKAKSISINDNLIIKGNNLLALNSLKRTFTSKVKLIYIDPPYNTGNDSFGYNDSFNHSTWLTFMKNRLELAKDLLKNDGFFCCHIDDHEGQYLKILLDEIFGRENFLTIFNVRVRYPDKTLKQDMDFHKEVEHIHIYRKTRQARPILNTKDSVLDKYIYYFKELKPGKEVTLGGKKVIIYQPDEYKLVKGDSSGTGRKEIWASGSILDGNSSGRFFRDYLTGRYKEDGYGVAYKVFDVGDEINGFRYFTGPKKQGATKGKYFQGVPSKQEEGGSSTVPINNYYDLAGSFGNCRTEGGVELRSGKKPELLLKILLNHFSEENDLVLDFHLGSGTTNAVALKMNRRFIGIEQLDYGENDSVRRLINVINGDKTGISNDVEWQGGGSFIYAELKQSNATFVEQIEAAKDSATLWKIWEQMQETGFISYRIQPKTINAEKSSFEELSLEEQKQFLIELLDKNQLYVNYSEIDDETYQVSEEEKRLNRDFYRLSR